MIQLSKTGEDSHQIGLSCALSTHEVEGASGTPQESHLHMELGTPLKAGLPTFPGAEALNNAPEVLRATPATHALFAKRQVLAARPSPCSTGAAGTVLGMSFCGQI